MIAPKLVEHGIQTEDSDVRAHVSPTAKKLFVFKTQDMLNEVNTSKYKVVSAGQEGVEGITAKGYLVPWKDLNFVRHIESNYDWWSAFNNTLTETAKGKYAVSVVVAAMKAGKFPFWVEPKRVFDVQVDIKGTDITVNGNFKIQVKCDLRAGITGNLFIQFAECNPLKRF